MTMATWPALWPRLWPSAAADAPLWLYLLVAAWLLVAMGVNAYHEASRYVSMEWPSKINSSSVSSGRVIVSEVSSQELRGLHSSTTASKSPVVRSVDIQPATEMEMMRMHVPVAPTMYNVPHKPSIQRTATQTSARDEPAPCVVEPSQQQQPQHQQPLLLTEAHSSVARVHASTARWKGLRGWWLPLLSSLALVALCGPTTQALAVNADAVASYIVLVSIPVLDKVLPLKNLAQELLQRGYHVGFALPENCRHWVSDLDQLEFISLGNFDLKRHPSHHESSSLHQLHTMDVYDSYTATLRYYASFQRPMFRALMDDFEDDRPDLLIIDRYTFAGFDASHALGIPYVVNSPSLLLDLDAPPAYISAPFSNLTMLTPSVLERCQNSFYRLRFRLAVVHVFKEINHARHDHGLPAVQSKHDLYGRALVLVDSMFGLDEPRPLTPQFQMVGMLAATAARTPTTSSAASTATRLSPEFRQWIQSDTTTPVVLISFHGDTPLSPEVVTALLNGLETINARLVWRITLQEQAAFDLRSRARSSVFFLRDNDRDVDESLVLQHAPVALLITPGNFFSVQQAFSLGVPVLGIPFLAEQWETLNMVVRTGAGVQLPAATLRDQQIHHAAVALLQKPQFAASAFRMGEILRTGGGTKRAADHIGSIVEFGAAHVLPARNAQPLYKTFMVDVYLVYGAILFGAAVVLRTCFAVISTILQIAPEVHLGMALDDDGHEDLQGDIQKPPHQNATHTQNQQQPQGHSHGHHHPHHPNYHAAHSKAKVL